MSGYTFYVNPITISQNTQLVAIPTNNIENIPDTYDYLLDVNVAPRGSTLNAIFVNASYRWSSGSNDVGFNFTFNTDFVNGVLNNAHTGVSVGCGNVTQGKFNNQDFTASQQAIAMKLKEIMAVKIFGSAAAVTAFSPATYSGYSTNMPGLISAALSGVITDSNRTDDKPLFEQYVSSGRFAQDQENYILNYANTDPQWIPFNFFNSVIDIKMTLTGSVQDSASTTINVSTYPTVHYPSSALIGGTTIPSTGIYSIPLLLRLHD